MLEKAKEHTGMIVNAEADDEAEKVGTTAKAARRAGQPV